jgi:hypothetical protein
MCGAKMMVKTNARKVAEPTLVRFCQIPANSDELFWEHMGYGPSKSYGLWGSAILWVLIGFN